MEFLKKNKTTIIALAIVLLGVVGYVMFFRGTGIENANTALVTFGNQEVLATNQQFLALFLELQRVEFDTRVLTDTTFRNLTDYTRAVSPVPSGRANPFAPF